MNPVLRALLLSLIGLGIVVGAVWLLAGRTVDGLENRALAFFEVYWSDAPDQQEKSDRMLARSALARPDRRVYRGRKYYKRVLGAWKGSQGVVRHVPDGRGGGRIALNMAFEGGEAVARFQMEQEQGKPMITSIAIDVPRPKDTGDTWRNPRVFVRALLRNWAKKQPDSIWDQFADSLQQRRPQEAFRHATEAFLTERSPKPKVEIVSSDERDGDVADVKAKLLFEEGAVDVEVRLHWLAGHWQATRFQVEGL